MLKKVLILIPLFFLAVVLTNWRSEKLIVIVDEPNQNIIQAFHDFETFVNSHQTVAAETLCQGGFINPTRKELKQVTNTILKNRNVKTQDEAGITCLSEAHKWVLFSALNNDEYYCIDSSKTKGKYGVDREKIQCHK